MIQPSIQSSLFVNPLGVPSIRANHIYMNRRCLFVNRRVDRLGPVVDSFRKPHCELVRSGVGRVTAVANVTAEINGVVTTDASRQRVQWLCLSQHLTSLLDDILALPAHANDGTRAEKLDETGKKALLAEIGVVFSSHFFSGPYHFQAHQLVATLFETRDNVANDSTLNAIGLDGQKCPFLIGSWLSVHRHDFFALGQGDRAYGSSESESCNGGKAESRSCRSDDNSLMCMILCDDKTRQYKEKETWCVSRVTRKTEQL
jgi:hypothetical protein